MSVWRPLRPFLVAFAAAVPGILVRLAHVHLDPPLTTLVAGAAILGAAFILVWACDAAQADVSQALALAVVALIAVLPEYAVDMYFTWQAGKFPDGDYSQYAVANMTGANRLLIGVGWAAIAALFWARTRKPVRLDSERRTELAFLGAATLYAFLIPLKGSLAWYDGIVFIGLYAWYVGVAARRPRTEEHAEGPAQLLIGLPKVPRRAATLALFLFAGGAILANAEPFCEGLVASGKALRINEFLLVQWLAPLASETPEFVIAIMFVLRGRAGLALGSLLSAKLNQWTLLVGMIPVVFAVSHGSIDHPIPMGDLQMSEILLTAAQSLFAVVLLGAMTLSVGQAFLLFGLFVGQLLTPKGVVSALGDTPGLGGRPVHLFFSLVYVLTAIALFLDQPGRLKGMWRGLQAHPADGERAGVALVSARTDAADASSGAPSGCGPDAEPADEQAGSPGDRSEPA